VRFWDASAVVPLLVEEEASGALRKRLAEDGEAVIWWGTTVECASALARRERDKSLTRAEVTRAEQRLRRLAEAWLEVLPTDPVRGMAQRLLRVHPLRAADALQLAAAVVAAEHEPASLEFVVLDDRLAEAAEKEGFVVLGA
jgi:predicted nucleic acid-binding protein